MIFDIFASGGQGALLKNRPLHPHKTFVEPIWWAKIKEAICLQQ